jgi:hypothetical protein
MAYYKQASATNQVKVGTGKLFGFIFSSTSSGTITVYDTLDGDTNDPKIIETITPTAGTVLSFPVGIQFNKGLYLVVANTLQFTVVYE